MRIVTGAVIFLLFAAQPASSSEVFVTQITNQVTNQATNQATAAERSDAAVAKSIVSSALLALPVKLNATGSFMQTAAVPGANTSVLLQSGTDNLAAVTQAGGANASTVLQHGNGNQAVVTQRH